MRAVGHAGTLDPFATGLLVVLLGRATRLARFVEAEQKVYQAVVRLGVATDTGDPTGTVTAEIEPEVWPTRATLERAAAGMVGRQCQVPPAYSAKHVAGKRAYQLARAGEIVELPPVEIVVHGITLGEWTPPRLELTATVGRGTYLRTLAMDLGARVALPAHCAMLRRTAIGPWLVVDAIAPEAVTSEAVRPPAEMVGGMPKVSVDAADRRHLGFGRAIPQRLPGDGRAALLSEDGALLAIAAAVDGMWQPEVVLEPAA